jgi:hypothetical protein
MQYELIFCGSLVQYWKVVYAEWQRPSRKDLLAQEPFRLSHTHPPKEFEEVTIEFLGEERRLGLVTVDALSGSDGKSVKLIVHIEPEAYETKGEFALTKWNKLKSAWKRRDLLIDPIAQFQPKKKRGIQDGTKNKIKRLREIRLEDLECNGSFRSRKAAMDDVKITDKTWRKYDPKTYDNWDIKSYKPGKYPKKE